MLILKIAACVLAVAFALIVAAELYERRRQIGVRERQGNDL